MLRKTENTKSPCTLVLKNSDSEGRIAKDHIFSVYYCDVIYLNQQFESS